MTTGWRRLAVAAWALALAAPLRAQPAVPGSPPAPAVFEARLLRTGLYTITGGGATSLLRLSAQGLVLVDAKAPGQYATLMSQIRRINRISDLPMRVVILTGDQDAQSGNHARFLAAGVPVIAPAGARLQEPAAAPAASAASASAKPPAPIIRFEKDYQLRVGGAEVRVLHVGPAHASSDTVVHFPDLKVVAVGDLVPPEGGEPRVAEGGSLAGWATALDQVLQLDFDLAVPSSGPVLTRSELAAARARLRSAPAPGT